MNWEDHSIAPQVKALLEQRDSLIAQAEASADASATELIRDEISRLYDEAFGLIEQADAADSLNGALSNSYLDRGHSLTEDDTFDWKEHPIADEVMRLLDIAEGYSDRAGDEEDEVKAAALLAQSDLFKEEAGQLVSDTDEEEGLSDKLADAYHEWGMNKLRHAIDQAAVRFAKDFDNAKPVEQNEADKPSD